MWEIDKWVVERALQLKHEDCRYHINLSGFTCCKKGFADFVKKTAEKNETNIQRLHFEVTEQLTINSYKEINLLKAMGCRFGVDDFMTGFNSFEVLKLLNPNFVKIPGKLTWHIGDKVALTLIEAILKICADLSIAVIAESVETEITWRTLLEINEQYNCELYGQGYLFGKPQKCCPVGSLAVADNK